MTVNKQIIYQNGKIEIVTKQEHEFSELEKKILNILSIDGYYEIKNLDESNNEYYACERLKELGLVRENYDAWYYTVEVVNSDEVGSFFLQIIKVGA